MNVSKTINELFGENTLVLWNEQSKNAFVVDPGMMTDLERSALVNIIDENQLHVQGVLLTHVHVDHACSARWIADRYGVKIMAGHDEAYAQAMPAQAQMFHLKIQPQPLTIDRILEDGETLMLDDEKIIVSATPGHSPGGLIFYIPSMKMALVGDSIFQCSIGRTDLAMGSFTDLMKSIHEKIMTLPDETTLLPGHGPSTTVANEKKYNPYL